MKGSIVNLKFLVMVSLLSSRASLGRRLDAIPEAKDLLCRLLVRSVVVVCRAADSRVGWPIPKVRACNPATISKMRFEDIELSLSRRESEGLGGFPVSSIRAQAFARKVAQSRELQNLKVGDILPIFTIIANVGVIIWRDWRRAALVAAGAALLTIGVILAKPDVWLDVLAMLVIYSGFWWASRAKPRERHTLAAA